MFYTGNTVEDSKHEAITKKLMKAGATTTWQIDPNVFRLIGS